MKQIDRYRRRASSYVAVLSTAMIVATIGLSALMATRIQRREVENTNDAARARLYAQSASDLALYSLSASTTCRCPSSRAEAR